MKRFTITAIAIFAIATVCIVSANLLADTASTVFNAMEVM